MSTASYPRWPLFALAMAYFATGTGSLAIIGLLPPMARDLNVSPAAVAQLVTVFALTFAVAAPALQILLGRLPRRRLLLGSLLLMGAGSLLSAAAPNYATLVAARIVMAIGAAGVGPVASALGATLVAPAQQGRALATVFGGLTVATVVGVPLAAWVGSFMDWRWAFAGLGILTAAVAGVVAWLIRDRSAAPPVTLGNFLHVFRSAPGAWALAATLLQMAAQFATYTLVAPVLTERFHLTPQLVSAALLLFGVAGVVGNTLAGKLGDSIGAVRTLWLALVGMGLVFASLYVVPQTPAVGLALISVWAVLGLMFQAPQQQRLIMLDPPMRGLLLAMNASALYLGMSAGSLVGSQAYARSGTVYLPLISLGFVALALGAMGLSRRAERQAAAQAAHDLGGNGRPAPALPQ
jgi:DHA1 family inner membrane transport protein